QLAERGLSEDTVLTTDDLVQGDNAFFAATGITDGPLLGGVRVQRRNVRTHSIVMRSRSGTVRVVDATHRIEKMNLLLASNCRAAQPGRSRPAGPVSRSGRGW